ncbi:MAG: hypothetical protein DCC75_00635 [Proteobacteria bacterium]|nr:MAG: hypothetical protein DCC75_00635 [Pseudomonadota bacterium]
MKTANSQSWKKHSAARRSLRYQEGGDPLAIDKVLERVLKRTGMDRDLARYRFVRHWEEIVGGEIAKRTRPECLRQGALVVRVSNSAWAQELSFHKEVIIKRLNKFLGEQDAVSDVQFYVSG